MDGWIIREQIRQSLLWGVLYLGTLFVLAPSSSDASLRYYDVLPARQNFGPYTRQELLIKLLIRLNLNLIKLLGS